VTTYVTKYERTVIYVKIQQHRLALIYINLMKAPLDASVFDATRSSTPENKANVCVRLEE
jgi:hypothetical protein